MKSIIMLLISVIFSQLAFAEGPACKAIFEDQVQKTVANLAALRVQIDQAKASGQSSVALTALEKDYLRNENSLIQHVTANQSMSVQEVVALLKAEISKIQSRAIVEKKDEKKRQEKEQKRIEESVRGPEVLTFELIEPGSFKMGQDRVNVEITKRFDMANAPTTRLTYFAVVELFRERFGDDFELRRKFANEFDLKETAPIAYLSYHDVQQWIIALNELSKIDEPRLRAIIPGHNKGDVYRLPTEAEWEFVASARGTIKGDDYFNGGKWQDYAWGYENADQVPQPVMGKTPLAFEGHEFYDMLGNVAEMVQDGYSEMLPGGVDPVVPFKGSYIYRGGHANQNSFSIRSRQFEDGSDRYVGFRLVRVRD